MTHNLVWNLNGAYGVLGLNSIAIISDLSISPPPHTPVLQILLAFVSYYELSNFKPDFPLCEASRHPMSLFYKI
jgi:hypothetical protein